MRACGLLVVLSASLLLGACGGDGDRTAAPPGSKPTAAPPATGDASSTPTPHSAPTRDSTPTPGADDVEGECSAAALPAEVPAQELPPAVARTRDALVSAAASCDYRALQALTSPGRFTFSYGLQESPAAYWREREQAGEEPLRILAELLALPHARLPNGLYVWPAAHAGTPTESDWRELESVYDAETLRRLRRAPSYLGHRVGITRAGEWQFFVAGD